MRRPPFQLPGSGAHPLFPLNSNYRCAALTSPFSPPLSSPQAIRGRLSRALRLPPQALHGDHAVVPCRASRMWVSLACRALVGNPRNQWKRRTKGGIRRSGAFRGPGGGRVSGAHVVNVFSPALGGRGTSLSPESAMDVCHPALRVLFFPPLIVNKAQGNDASRGQMNGDVVARLPDAADMSRWPSHLRSCGVCGRRRDRVRAHVHLARAGRLGSKTVPLCPCEISPTCKIYPQVPSL